MKKSIFQLLTILLIISSCQIDREKKIDREKFTFKMGSDTQLFFKNVRQSYYDLEENKAAKFNVFRFSNREKTNQKPVLNLAIVINYLQDEAYLLMEPNTAMGDLPFSIVSTDSSGQTNTITLTSQNRESTLHFVTDLYEHLLQGNSFELELDGKKTGLFTKPNEKEAFRITVSDYYRLTRIY